MLLESILRPIYLLIEKIIDTFPIIPKFAYSLSGLVPFLKIANALLPSGYLLTFLTTVIVLKNFSLFWAVFEWLYKKIPGVS